MKKSLLFWAIASVSALIIIITLIYNLNYLNKFYQQTRPATESEKQIITEILNKSMNINGYEIKIGNVYESKHASLVQVEIIKDKEICVLGKRLCGLSKV